MYCTNPNFSYKHGFTECRKCHACKCNQRRELADRLKIERRYWKYAYFVTLTYAPEFYPKDGSVDKEELRKYFKRVCKSVGEKITLMGVGEYGDETERAHYHCAIYSNIPIYKNLIDCWSKEGTPIGFVTVEQLSNRRCSYIAGYVTKKMLKMDDERLDGRSPEFRILPRRPALGYGLIYELALRCFQSSSFRAQFVNRTFVPHVINLNGEWIRLPRYVRDHLKGFFDDYDHKIKQQRFRRQKAFNDAQILKSITSSYDHMLHRLDIKWQWIKEDFKDVFDQLNKLNVDSYNKRKRRLL